MAGKRPSKKVKPAEPAAAQTRTRPTALLGKAIIALTVREILDEELAVRLL